MSPEPQNLSSTESLQRAQSNRVSGSAGSNLFKPYTLHPKPLNSKSKTLNGGCLLWFAGSGAFPQGSVGVDADLFADPPPDACGFWDRS